MKATVTLNHRAIQIDDQDQLFYSGEIAPCRTSKERWPELLAKVKAAGCTAVTFYIPWNWHELSEGKFDFEGQTCPERDLLGFLDAVAAASLYAVVRPGPFITAEWRHGGIPDWFISAHPEALALDANDQPPSLDLYYPPVSYLHPAYLEACQRWFKAIIPILAGRQYHNGGPIIEVQLDDEPSYYQLLKGNPLAVDYNPVVAGDSKRTGFYQNWLESRFGGDLGLLNDVYSASYRSFAEASPPRFRLQTARELPRFLDWYYCKLDIINEHMARLYQWVRDNNLTVPLTILFPYLAQYYASDRLPRDFARRGLPIHITGECYPAGTDGNVDHLAEDAVGHIVGNTEAYRSWWKFGEGPPVSIEAQCSLTAHIEWHGLEMYYSLLLAHGLNGINFYLMVGGETPRGYELGLGRTYDVGSPIASTGELRPHYWLIRRLGEWMETHHTALSCTEPVSAICFGYYPPYEPAGYGIDTLAAGLNDDLRDALLSYFGMEGLALGSLATLLPLSGVDFSMANLEQADSSYLSQYKQLWTAGMDFMSHAVQQKLVEYVENGGHLVLLPRVPYLDENLNPHSGPLATLFPAKPLCLSKGTRRGRYTPSHAVDLPSYGIDRAPISDYIDTFDLPLKVKAFAFDSISGKPCAYTVHHGDGKATLLGFKLRYQWDPYASLKRLVNAVLDQSDIARPAYAEGWELIASLRRGEGHTFLFIANPSDLRQSAKIHYLDENKNPHIFPQLISGITVPRRGGLNLNLEADIPDAPVRLLYCTSQIQAWNGSKAGVRLKLYAHPGVNGEAAFRLPAQPSLISVNNNPPIRQEWDADTGVLTVVYGHTSEYIDLEIAVGSS